MRRCHDDQLLLSSRHATEKIDQKSNSVSNIIGMLFGIAFILAYALGVVMNSCSTTSWPGFDDTIGMLSDIVYFIANTLGVVMTSGPTSTWRGYDNIIGMISAKVDDIPEVVMTDDQNQTNISDDSSTIVKMTIQIGITAMMYAVITYIMGVMRTANTWIKYFIETSMRLGVCVHTSPRTSLSSSQHSSSNSSTQPPPTCPMTSSKWRNACELEDCVLRAAAFRLAAGA